MSLDGLDPAGVYFGTRSGKLYGSRDEGRSWELLREGLPAIVCVKAAVVARRAGKRAAGARARTGRKRLRKTA